MDEKNMTALVSCFSRAYHYKNNKYKIYSDNLAEKIISEEEYNNISFNMSNGISYFNPKFKGTTEEALKWIVDNQLSPSVLARSAFAEEELKKAINKGCKQYLIFASGYDTSAYKKEMFDISVFEIDKKEIINDKKKRLIKNNVDTSNVNYIDCDFTDENWINSINESSYNKNIISFSSLLGISYYLSKKDFNKMIKSISDIICKGSLLVFDYPTFESGVETNKNEELAKEANEEMKSKYSYSEIDKMLLENGLAIFKQFNNEEMTDSYFEEYNNHNPKNMMSAPKGVSYCLAIKK